MNYPHFRAVSTILVILIACMVTTDASAAPKPALIRDVDRTASSPKSFSCSLTPSTQECTFIGSPFFTPGVTFVVEYVSYRAIYCTGCISPTKLLSVSLGCAPSLSGGGPDFLPLGIPVADGPNEYVSWGGPVTQVYLIGGCTGSFNWEASGPLISFNAQVTGHYEAPN